MRPRHARQLTHIREHILVKEHILVREHITSAREVAHKESLLPLLPLLSTRRRMTLILFSGVNFLILPSRPASTSLTAFASNKPPSSTCYAEDGAEVDDKPVLHKETF